MSLIRIYVPSYSYYEASLFREEQVLLSMAEGIRKSGQDVKVVEGFDDVQPCDVAVIGGWDKLRYQKVIESQKAVGARTLVIKKGYIQPNRDFKVGDYYSVGWDGLNGDADFCNETSPPDRWEKLGIELKPWRSSGEHIILACQIPTDGNVAGTDIVRWCGERVIALRELTKRPILFRPHPLAKDITPDIPGTRRSEIPLLKDLEGAWAVVTYNSASSSLAVIDGIPIFVHDKKSMAWDMANRNINDIENPQMPDRRQWAANLAYTQWTKDEIASGEAWTHIRRGAPIQVRQTSTGRAFKITTRIDEITKIGSSQLQSVLPAPKSVKIELTGRCNYRCGFCALRTREKQPVQDMDIVLFKRIVTEMREAGVQEIGVFYLGESFMNPRLLIDAVKFAKQELKFPYVFLTTNGSLAVPEFVEECFEAKLDSLKFSINAADDEQFRSVMGVKSGLYRDAFTNLKAARAVRDAKKYSCGLYASSIKYDGEQQTKMQALLSRHVLPYVDQHYWLPLYSMGSLAEQREAELGYRPTAGNQGRLGALRDPLPCWSAFTEGHVRADGGLSLCCFDSDGRFVVGDLTRQSFMEAWNSAEFQQVREAHLRKDVTGTICEKCVAY